MPEISWNFHCAEFALGEASKTLNRDLWQELGGVPRSPRQLAGLYRRLSVTNIADATSAVFGEPIDPKQAMRGDVVMIDNALGICRGELVEMADRMQPLGRASKAWKVTSRLQP